MVPFLYEARRTVLTYPFLFENEDFFSGLAYRSHVSGENGHGKHIFSKALAAQRWCRFQSLLRFRVEGQKRFKNTTCGRGFR